MLNTLKYFVSSFPLPWCSCVYLSRYTLSPYQWSSYTLLAPAQYLYRHRVIMIAHGARTTTKHKNRKPRVNETWELRNLLRLHLSIDSTPMPAGSEPNPSFSPEELVPAPLAYLSKQSILYRCALQDIYVHPCSNQQSALRFRINFSLRLTAAAILSSEDTCRQQVHQLVPALSRAPKTLYR